MKFGLFGGAMQQRGETADSTGYEQFVEYVVEADRLGYESIFIVEHHFSGIGQVSASLNLHCFMAAKTKNIRLGTAVMVLPWHNPILLAEQAATLDMVSGGRLDFGIGRGYRDIEFKGFCIPKEEAQERYEECINLMIKGWTSQERFSYHSDNWNFEDIIVEPAPVQRPHPPLWNAAGSPDSISRVAKTDMKLLLDQFGDMALTEERVENFRSSCAAAGRTFDPMDVALSRTIIVVDTQEEVRTTYAERVERQKNINQFGALPGLPEDAEPTSFDDPALLKEDAYIIGTPDQVLEKLKRIEAMGVGRILMTTIGGPELLQRVANDIMPEFDTALRAAE